MRAAVLVGFAMAGCIDGGEDLGEGTLDMAVEPPLVTDMAPALGAADGAAILGPTYTEYPLAAHGGGGGAYTGHVTPPAVIYAVRVSAGARVDSISFGWYQPTRYDNLYQSGNAWGTTPSYGGGGGTNNGWWYCPAGQGVIGIRGSSGTVVDRIGVICGDVNNPNPYSPYVTYSPLWGGSGGGWFDDRCSGGRLVSSFNVRSGSMLDNLQAICINAH